jgi:diketogulonate reductase-like aldo/keto reductase
LIDYCHQKGIANASYAALASIVRHLGGPVDQVVKDIAKELGLTEDQVLLKWAHQVTYGGIVITTSLKKERLQGQVKAFSHMPDLSDAHVQAIIHAGKKLHYRRFVSTLC